LAALLDAQRRLPPGRSGGPARARAPPAVVEPDAGVPARAVAPAAQGAGGGLRAPGRQPRLEFPRGRPRSIVAAAIPAGGCRQQRPTPRGPPGGRPRPAREPSALVHGSPRSVGRTDSPLVGVAPAVLTAAWSRGQPQAAQDGVKFRVAGHAESPHCRALEGQVASLGLNEHVELLGHLPRTQALALMSRSHLGVVLAQDQVLSIPAKLYEPVALGIPMLVVAEQGSAAALEGQRLGASVVEPQDAERVAPHRALVWRSDLCT